MAISPQMSSISATDLSLKPSTFWTFTSPRVIDSLFHTPFRATAGCSTARCVGAMRYAMDLGYLTELGLKVQHLQ